MTHRTFIYIFVLLIATVTAFAQHPPRPQGPPGGFGDPPPGRGGQMPGDGPRRPGNDPGRDGGPDGRDGGPRRGWLRSLDAGKDGTVDLREIQAAGQRTFAEFDRDQNGVIDATEFRVKPADGESKQILPPFFFAEALDRGESLSRVEFDRAVQTQFDRIDRNRDGVIDASESKSDGNMDRPPGPMQPNAKFIAAELRFGDKLIIGQPFSADMEIEDTRRLFDGTTVTKKITGATYRDSAGRTRREQPMQIGGIPLLGSDNKPQTLVFINDFSARTQYFLDPANKVARKSPINGMAPPDQGDRPEGTLVDLGTKMIEGVKVVGTRVTFEIPVGQIGNDKPIPVVSENWFSPELQVMIMTRHSDPLAGEHIFRLTNIRRSEPSTELFQVPSGYKIVGKQDRD